MSQHLHLTRNTIIRILNACKRDNSKHFKASQFSNSFQQKPSDNLNVCKKNDIKRVRVHIEQRDCNAMSCNCQEGAVNKQRSFFCSDMLGKDDLHAQCSMHVLLGGRAVHCQLGSRSRRQRIAMFVSQMFGQ